MVFYFIIVNVLYDYLNIQINKYINILHNITKPINTPKTTYWSFKKRDESLNSVLFNL